MATPSTSKGLSFQDPKVRVTEQPNPLTIDLDVSSPSEIVSLLAQVDAEAMERFGLRNGDGSADAFWSGPVCRLAAAMSTARTVVLGGCGTSGRVAYLLARQWDCDESDEAGAGSTRARARVLYSIAGGDAALFAAREAFEDSAEAGAADLAACLEAEGRGPAGPGVLYVGITCGMSAMYVAGQLNAILDAGGAACLLGFNPVEASRPGFLPAAERVAREGILATVPLGPEAVTGSSRMKGGTFTKIILETAFAAAFAAAAGAADESSLAERTRRATDPGAGYAAAWEAAYGGDSAGKVVLADACAACGDALNAGGSIHYIASDALAVMAMIDASEQRPTFGAHSDDIRAYALLPSSPDARNRWSSLVTRTGDLSRNTARHFADVVSPTLVPGRDVVVLVLGRSAQEVPDWLLETLNALRGTLFVVLSDGCSVDAPATDAVIAAGARGVLDIAAARGRHAEIALKFALNAMSTAAHVLKGTVYRNRMVNLMVTNAKLFHRSVDIIAAVATVDADTAVRALLASIYCGPGAPEPRPAVAAEVQADPEDVPAHLRAATDRTGIVPLAILVALDPRGVNATDVAKIATRMTREPRVRVLLAKAMENAAA